MITVHHLEHSRSHRVLWLLEELGLPYEIKRYQRDPKTLLAPDELKQIHPLGKSPVITDGEIHVAESGAIIEYLLGTYDADQQFSPPRGTADHRDYIYWLHYAEGSFMSPLLLKLVFDRLPKSDMPFFIRPIVKGLAKKVNSTYIDKQIGLHVNHINEFMSERTWFAGQSFSGADVQMSYPLMAAAGRSDLSKHSNITEFIARIRDRRAFRKAIERGGAVELPRT